MLKKDLRRQYKQLRKQLSVDEIEEMSLAIANRTLQLDIWDKTYFHLFLSIEEQKEVDTEYLLHILAGKDKEIVISKSDFESREMVHYLLTDNTRFKKNKHNIPEPVDGIEVPTKKIEVVFVPLLAYDKKGNRVGYGKGFYDAFLAQCSSDVIKIGLSFFEPEEIIEDILETDIQLDYCVTPKTTNVFRETSF
ncbi:MAG: 5-formyltetrahydrofolate cyclo-ligase [Flavobacterium sp.]